MDEAAECPSQTDVTDGCEAPPLPREAPPPTPPPPTGAEDSTSTTQDDDTYCNKRKADFSSDDDSTGSVASDEIDKLLDEGLKEARKNEDVIIRKKLICKRYTKDVYDILPEDWVMINHICGLPLYLNRKTRVCTWSRPYFLGPGSARKHEVPQSAIPCLHYERSKRKALSRENNFAEQTSSSEAATTDTITTTTTTTTSITNTNITDTTNTNSNATNTSNNATNTSNNATDTTINDTNSKTTNTTTTTTFNNTGSTGTIRDASETEQTPEAEPTTTTVPASGEIPPDLQDSTGACPMEITEGASASDSSSISQTASGEASLMTPQQMQVMNRVGIETAQECQVHLNAEQLRDYAKSRFDIEEVTVRQFKSWGARREFQREKKVKNPPTLPSSTHLITCEIPSAGVRSKRKEFVLNPYGKGPVGILHEFVQHSLREQPKYTFKELSSSETPYCATLLIAEIEYGTGYGSSKKQAKTAAAQAALDILLPTWRGLQKSDDKDDKDPAQDSKQHELDFFDDISIEDPRLAGLCTTTGQQSPFHILVECLRRNFGLVNENEIRHQILKESEKSQRIEYQMSVGSHTVKVRAKNKRDGKQLASQQLLAKMHQYISTWGGILRLYGHNSYKTPRDKRQEQQAITDLQTKSTASGPNHYILNKLQEEMLKLPAEQEEAQSAGSSNMKMVKM